MNVARVLGHCLVCLALAVPLGAQTQSATGQLIPFPPDDWGAEMLPIREWLQLQTLDQFDVYHDFKFTNRLTQSGITFEHRSTPDSGRFYQPNHYDHGNSLVVADVDGDRLLDIYFVSQLGPNELWRNEGGGRFRNITASAGVALEDRLSAGASFADYDNDGDADLYVTSVRMGNVLFQNDGKGRFRDVTAEAGVQHTGHSSGAVFFDYDSDGRLDLFLTNVGKYTTDERSTAGYWIGIALEHPEGDAFSGHLVPSRTEYSVLYRNLGDGKFQDVTEAAGVRTGIWSGDASPVDLNGDGRMDLYVLNMQGDDQYFENVDGRSFVERRQHYFPKTPWGTMGVKFFDYNRDGRIDLMLTDMHSDMSRRVTPGYEKHKSMMLWDEETLQGGEDNIFGNAFYERQTDGSFLEISDEIGAENYWPWGISVDDLNADGWDDVFISSSMNFPWNYGVNTVLLNNNGERFLDSEFILGVEPRTYLEDRSWHQHEPKLETKKPWFQIDCSGRDASYFLCRGRSGAATVMGNVGTRTSVLFDLDEDGDLDIVTGEFNDAPQVLISDLSDRRTIRFVKIRLVGSTSNRDGLGARVTVEVDGASYTKVHDGKSGYLSQSSKPLYFGLGEAASIDRVVVSWPSGTQQTVTEGLTVSSTIEIREPR